MGRNNSKDGNQHEALGSHLSNEDIIRAWSVFRNKCIGAAAFLGAA